MYFMLIRPDQKRRKQQQSLLASMQKGDSVVTVSGMHGVISKLTDKTVTLRVDSVEITFDRTSVARIERGDAAPAAKT
jgi:preprotein translocase subunit YajC